MKLLSLGGRVYVDCPSCGDANIYEPVDLWEIEDPHRQPRVSTIM
ncbi:MAG: hypothetical protein ACK5AZ_02290 [Bryobacteraceae bacterium]